MLTKFLVLERPIHTTPPLYTYIMGVRLALVVHFLDLTYRGPKVRGPLALSFSDFSFSTKRYQLLDSRQSEKDALDACA